MSTLAEAGLVTLTVAESTAAAGLGWWLRRVLATVRDTAIKVTIMHASIPGITSRLEAVETRVSSVETTQAATNQSVALLLAGQIRRVT